MKCFSSIVTLTGAAAMANAVAIHTPANAISHIVSTSLSDYSIPTDSPKERASLLSEVYAHSRLLSSLESPSHPTTTSSVQVIATTTSTSGSKVSTSLWFRPDGRHTHSPEDTARILREANDYHSFHSMEASRKAEQASSATEAAMLGARAAEPSRGPLTYEYVSGVVSHTAVSPVAAAPAATAPAVCTPADGTACAVRVPAPDTGDIEARDAYLDPHKCFFEEDTHLSPNCIPHPPLGERGHGPMLLPSHPVSNTNADAAGIAQTPTPTTTAAASAVVYEADNEKRDVDASAGWSTILVTTWTEYGTPTATTWTERWTEINGEPAATGAAAPAVSGSGSGSVAGESGAGANANAGYSTITILTQTDRAPAAIGAATATVTETVTVTASCSATADADDVALYNAASAVAKTEIAESLAQSEGVDSGDDMTVVVTKTRPAVPFPTTTGALKANQPVSAYASASTAVDESDDFNDSDDVVVTVEATRTAPPAEATATAVVEESEDSDNAVVTAKATHTASASAIANSFSSSENGDDVVVTVTATRTGSGTLSASATTANIHPRAPAETRTPADIVLLPPSAACNPANGCNPHMPLPQDVEEYVSARKEGYSTEPWDANAFASIFGEGVREPTAGWRYTGPDNNGKRYGKKGWKGEPNEWEKEKIEGKDD